MNRRDFLKNSSVTGLTITSLGFACNAPVGTNEEAKKSAPPASYEDFELNEITIDELQQKMQSGTHTSRSITELYFKRINDIDKKGPTINSVIELNPDALAIADELDKQRKAGKVRGPLHGIPVLIKDNIDTADKMMTTAGALALEGNRSSKDAFIVKQLREAGAVLLGKTNLSEWANFRARGRRAVGVAGADKQKTPSCLIAIPVVRAQAQAPPSAQIFVRLRSERKRMAQLFHPPLFAALSG